MRAPSSYTNSPLVALYDLGTAVYPEAPFHPGFRYPEYQQPDVSASPNPVYDAVRELFRMLGMDAKGYGRPGWNPLGDLIRPGSRVLIKPNLVRHYHPYGLDPQSLVTNGSLVRAVCDYALKAAGAEGQVVIADAPLQSCDFASVMKLSGMDAVAHYYERIGLPVQVRDLRLVRAVVDRSSVYGKVLVQEENPGDPRGYTGLDLGPVSLHAGRLTAADKYRVTCYDPARMHRHHGGGRHEYVIANTLLEADVVLNLPKMKTHHKAGITGALKNFIGINGHKDCLPHHVQGSVEEGGDEYARASWIKSIDSRLLDQKESVGGPLVKKSMAVAHRILHATHMRQDGNGYWEGSWYGNDTISRTTVDLNRVVRYAGRDGRLRKEPQRSILSLVDGVLAGDRDGPLAPTPRPAGMLLAGFNPVAVDLAMARVMGFRHQAIATLRHALNREHEYPLVNFEACDLQTISNQRRWNGLHPDRSGAHLGFVPNKGWQGHIEL
ncbi:MAG: DUF362 domain-containing protein [Acidobacteriia bacterium]|nr:DUF362 domain-containing protein [Terriglobia bacterium]